MDLAAARLDVADDGHGTTADRLFHRLSEAIVSGAMQAGAKLSEPELATRYGTSRAPLREAIRRLEERKLVTCIAHQGARVAVLPATRIRELYLVREVLEGAAAREAAKRMSDTDTADLHALLNLHEARVASSDVYLQGADDDDFHFRIIHASGNATLGGLLDEYYLLIRMLRGRLRRQPGGARRALLEHRRIADALSDHDAELAEMLMRRHIAAASGRILRDLQDDADPTLPRLIPSQSLKRS